MFSGTYDTVTGPLTKDTPAPSDKLTLTSQ